jgi:hypothetical protein
LPLAEDAQQRAETGETMRLFDEGKYQAGSYFPVPPQSAMGLGYRSGEPNIG